MKIWPWSRIRELRAEYDELFERFLSLYKMQRKVLKYLDSVEPGQHICVRDQLYIFKPEGIWEAVEVKNGEV
jgi:hypothetical protein